MSEVVSQDRSQALAAGISGRAPSGAVSETICHVTSVASAVLADGQEVHRWRCSCGSGAQVATLHRARAEDLAGVHRKRARRAGGCLVACAIARVEEDGLRKRYVCACGKIGPWSADFDTWRHVTKERALEWNWRVHAGNIAGHRSRRAAASAHVMTLGRAGRLFDWRCSCGKTSRFPLSRFRAERNAEAHLRLTRRLASPGVRAPAGRAT